MTDKLALYNGALRYLGERALASLTEDRKPRRLLDGVWADQAVDNCLKMGFWKFALRTRKLDYDPDVTPQFGHRYAFTLNSDSNEYDYLKTYMVATGEYFSPGSWLREYHREAGRIYCDLTVIYIRYVSNHPQYGGDMSEWSPEFVELVQAYLANKIAPSLQNEKDQGSTFERFKQTKREALSSDAIEGPPMKRAMGNWVRARGNSYSYRD